jgi:outer membrane lipoprotein-sorting protein
MAFASISRHRARYLVPIGVAAITAVVVIAPQAASGAQHPNLAPRTAAQLLASLEQAQVPQFSGTTVETSRLGLPSIDPGELPAGISPGAESPLLQLVTLLTGSHTAQLAYGGPERQRVAIFLSDLSETDVVHNGADLWTYSSDGNTVSHTTVSDGSGEADTSDAGGAVDPTKMAEQALSEIDPSTAVTVDRTAEVAGRPAYQLDLAPRDARTLVSSVRIAIDSATSLPLRVEIWSHEDASKPALSVGFTSISMKAPSASTFNFTAPPHATVQGRPFDGLLSHGADTAPARTKAVSPATGTPKRVSKSESESVLGKDWTSVFVAQLAAPQPPPQLPATASAPGSTRKVQVRQVGGSLSDTLDQFATKVPLGHLLATRLVSILITTDNRIFIGAVTPAYIQQLAAGSAGQ